jgi:hypothetical protein
MDDGTEDRTDDGTDGWKASFRPRCPLIYKIFQLEDYVSYKIAKCIVKSRFFS